MRSPTLWTMIATGREPQDHGIDGFFATRQHLKAQRVFDVAHTAGQSVGTYSWLLTQAIDDPYDFVVPAWMARTPETFPAEYAPVQEIRLEHGNHASAYSPARSILRCIALGARLGTVENLFWFYWLDYWGLSEEERFARKMLAEVNLHTDIYLNLLATHDPQFTTFSLYGSDKLAHRFWHYMKPEVFSNASKSNLSLLNNAIRRYYTKADAAFGRILNAIPGHCHVILLSDHGMKADTAMPRQVFLNPRELFDLLDIENQLRYVEIQREIIIEPRGNYESVIQQLKATLETIKWPSDNQPVFRLRVREDGALSLRFNFSASWYPDSPVNLNETVLINGNAFPAEALFHVRTFSGNHDRAGILVMKGPGVQSNHELAETSLFDIAPTLLYLLDLPISHELEGEIVKQAFDDNWVENKPPVYIEAYPPLAESTVNTEPFAPLYERLQSVGYVD